MHSLTGTSYPTKILPSGKEVSCVHPITKEAGLVIAQAIIEKYNQISEKSQSNHDVNNKVNSIGDKEYNGNNR